MRKAYSYIRMSSDKQLRGDSLRRQLELSAEYAKANNLEIVDSIDGKPFKDIGVSGFRGMNSSSGVLSTFLQFLQDGKIEQNSVLLVESLDRLSRDNITNALTQFLNIINFGIEIVTLADNQKYTKELVDKNVGTLFVSLGIMFRANEESETKSRRLSAAWNNKRSLAGQKPLTKIAPAWLKHSEDDNKFHLINERAEVIKKIFDLCANSCGLWSITRYLNEHKIPVFGKSLIWNRSYIKKIISNRAVLGEYQPYTTIDGKRTPAGDPTIDYFPRVIPDELFYLAAAAIEKRTVNAAGRKGRTFTNLFSGLLFCKACGYRMSVRDRGAAPKGGKTLICNNKLQGGGCVTPDWKLDQFESIIFKYLYEVNFDELVNKDSEKPDQQSLITSLQQELKIKSTKIDNLIETSSDETFSQETKSRFVSQINKLESEITAIKTNILAAEKAMEFDRSQFDVFQNSTLKGIFKLVEQNKDDYYFRSTLNNLLSKIISRVELISEKTDYAPWEMTEDDTLVQEYREMNQKAKTLELDKLLKQPAFITFWKDQQRRIQVTYKTGVTRHIFVSEKFSIPVQKPLKASLQSPTS